MPGTARSSSENRQIGRAKSRFRITIFHLPSRIESAVSTLLALSNSKGVALRSEDSAISSVTNNSVRIPIVHPILSLRSFYRISEWLASIYRRMNGAGMVSHRQLSWSGSRNC